MARIPFRLRPEVQGYQTYGQFLANNDLTPSDRARAVADIRSGRAFNLISLERMWGVSTDEAQRLWKEAKHAKHLTVDELHNSAAAYQAYADGATDKQVRETYAVRLRTESREAAAVKAETFRALARQLEGRL
jgi:hypothetical protein